MCPNWCYLVAGASGLVATTEETVWEMRGEIWARIWATREEDDWLEDREDWPEDREDWPEDREDWPEEREEDWPNEKEEDWPATAEETV